MRDIIVLAIVAAGALAALRRPWIGLMLWTWISIMNPHRYTYGIAYATPVALIALTSTLLGMLLNPSQLRIPSKPGPVLWFVLFIVWMTLSWWFGLDQQGDYDQWIKVMKIDFAILLGMVLLHSKRHMLTLLWVVAGSLAILGVKGGIFTLLGGGEHRVWGPPGSFIEDNNEFGLALVMTIPLLRFLQLQTTSLWGKGALAVAMLLSATAALGTQSRGGLLAIAAMAAVLWWRGRNRFAGGVVILLAAFALTAAMPEAWFERMHTIDNYEEDGSAMGRLGAWSNAWNLAFDYPLGVGFNPGRQDLFDKYSSMPDVGARAAHSIYFQVLGNHGFIGLALFLLIWIATWLNAGWLRRHAAVIEQARWCADLGAMLQVSLVGYFVGGAFLSLSYYDLPYEIMLVSVIARAWVRSEGWVAAVATAPSWKAASLATHAHAK